MRHEVDRQQIHAHNFFLIYTILCTSPCISLVRLYLIPLTLLLYTWISESPGSDRGSRSSRSRSEPESGEAPSWVLPLEILPAAAGRLWLDPWRSFCARRSTTGFGREDDRGRSSCTIDPAFAYQYWFRLVLISLSTRALRTACWICRSCSLSISSMFPPGGTSGPE